MGFSTVSTIIFETCTALWLKLQPIVLPTPTINDWLRIAKGFEDRWNFHHCIGAIDGKHVQIQAPPNAGSRYFNYKGFHSLVLLGVCDHRYCFTLVDIGANGRQSDGGVFFRSKIGRYFEEESLKVPPPSKIEKTETILPYILVGDKAFPLSDYLLRPYTQQSNMEEKQLIFNYRLGRARRVIENTFGILCSRWRILRRPILGKRATIKAIIKATVCLHNFLMINKDNNSNCDSTINQVSTNEGAIQHYVGSEDSSLNMNPLSEIPLCSSAERLRDQFAEFFQEEGAVQWQFRHIYL
ncbi:uncharacterized protein LOC122850394 [Aphidius gifuensis]|nr:uncharacterized protein LOC122850394 [Aphidius gifuensis]